MIFSSETLEFNLIKEKISKLTYSKFAYNQIKDLPYLIIDVRGNGGGNSRYGRLICEYLIRKPQPHCLSPDKNMTPQNSAYKGKMYLLTSHFTFSAAESFVLDMRESGNAILIGEPTGGDTGNGPKRFKTNNNKFIFSR